MRAVADRLEDLTGVEYDDLDEALELSTWPALVRKRFVGAWRRLKGDTVTSVTPDPPRAAPTRVAPPPPLPLSPASNAPTTASASDDDATRDEAPARRPAKKAKTKAPAEPADATAGDAELARRLAMGLPPRRASRGCAPPAPPPRRPQPEAGDDTDDDFDELYSEVAGAPAPAAPWAVGDKVEAKFFVRADGHRNQYSRDFYPATITAVHGATVDVEYDTSDEETEEQLPLRHVRKRRRAPAAPPPAAPPKKKTKKAPAKTAHAPGDERSRLMAQCLKRGILCQGSATTMEYMQQKLAAYAGPEPADDLRVGGACFCRWRDRWYGAKILSVDGDSYRVHFLGCLLYTSPSPRD